MWFGWLSFFFKFVIELIGIGFVIIKTDTYRLRSVFRPIAVRFNQLGLIGLVGLIETLIIYICFFFFNKKNLFNKKIYVPSFLQPRQCQKPFHVHKWVGRLNLK